MSKNIAVSKSLKGTSILSNLASIDTLNVNNLNISNSTVEQILNGLQFDNVLITNSRIDSTVIGQGGALTGYFTDLTTYQSVTFYSTDMTKSVTWDPTAGVLSVDGNFSVNGCGLFGNIDICVNTIKAINTNGEINIIPQGLGSIFLKGPINNTVSSRGNYLTQLANGGVSFICTEDILLNSSGEGYNLFTFSDQNNTTTNGDISFTTDTGISPVGISTIRSSNGNIVITSTQTTKLRTGDSIQLTNTNSIPTFNGIYEVDSIYNTRSFSINTTTSSLISSGNTGVFTKLPNNNINLNASAYVTIPTNIPLAFSNTTNTIYGNTSGLFINSVTTSGSLGDITFSTGNTARIRIPQGTLLTFGENTSMSSSNMASMNYDSSGNMNILTNASNSSIIITSSLLTNNAINTRFYDPVLTIGDYKSTPLDLSDRGIEFRYPDPNSTSGDMLLGWFGYKTATGKFTFYTNATNTNEVMSGTPGNFEISSISVSTITLNSGGTLNLGCGNLINVNTITGCNGTININGSNNVTISAGNKLSLVSSQGVSLPNNVPLQFGSSGNSIISNTSGTMNFNANASMQFNTTVGNISLNTTTGNILLNTNKTIIVPNGTIVSLDGTSSGNTGISSDTSGNFLLSSVKNIYLSPSDGNVILNSALQLGSTCNSISGNTTGLFIIASCGSLNMMAYSSANLMSSNGNITLNAIVGDISFNLTQGNVRINNNKSLIFSSSGSVSGNSDGNLYVTGNSQASIVMTNISTINMLASSQINIRRGVLLNLSTDGSTFLVATSVGNLNINNTVGTTNLNAWNTTITVPTGGNINSTYGAFNAVSSTTSISSGTFVVSGTTGSLVNLNVQNVTTYDPILTLGVSTTGSSDKRDRGIEYYWYNATTGNMSMGWFGWKNTTGQFAFYSDSINNGEVISGTMGTIALGSALISNSLSFVNTGLIDMNCGTISNVNTLTGCRGTININASNQINASASNIFLNATNFVQLPLNVPLSFGNTSNSITTDTNGNITITSIGGAGKIILNSDVQINGTTENIYSTVTHMVDPIISIGGITSGPLINNNKDRGIEFYWSPDGITQKTGFFGFQHNTQRFVFIPTGTNSNEVYLGSVGNVQFANGYFDNLDVTCGTVSNVAVLTGCNASGLTMRSSYVNISTANVNLNTNTKLNFGNTSVSISSDTFGNLQLNTNTGGIYLTTNSSTGFVNLTQNSKLQFGSPTSGNSIYQDTSGNLNIISSIGNIALTPKYGTSGNVSIPLNNNLVFGTSTQNSISSDGTQLNLYGYNGVSINSSTVTFAGNVNILGNINAVSNSIVSQNYIYPLGTSQTLTITSIVNSTTTGNVNITTVSPSYLSIDDTVILSNTNSTPLINGTYTIVKIISPTTFSIAAPVLTQPGTTGIVNANLTTDQNADVGIQVNYWQNATGNGVTAGSAYYKTAYFGFIEATNKWVFYNNATISNLKNVTNGILGDIQVNTVNTNNISGFILNGPITAGSNAITGDNFQIQGGIINNTDIGDSVPASGRFTNLISTISTTLKNVNFGDTLNYAIERIHLSSLLPFQNPNIDVITSIVTVTGNGLNTYGTMGNASTDGQMKKIMISTMGSNSTFTLYFGTNLNTPNPLGGTPSKITFKRIGQSAEFIWDNTKTQWILSGGSGGYVS